MKEPGSRPPCKIHYPMRAADTLCAGLPALLDSVAASLPHVRPTGLGVVCTARDDRALLVYADAFGSTAYFNEVTRGVFWQGIGVAFKYTNEHTTHIIVPEDTTVRVQITRGPAVIAHDSAPEILDADTDDVLTIRRADETAVLLMPA